MFQAIVNQFYSINFNRSQNFAPSNVRKTHNFLQFMFGRSSFFSFEEIKMFLFWAKLMELVRTLAHASLWASFSGEQKTYHLRTYSLHIVDTKSFSKQS